MPIRDQCNYTTVIEKYLLKMNIIQVGIYAGKALNDPNVPFNLQSRFVGKTKADIYRKCTVF